jgi:hypothetical protein
LIAQLEGSFNLRFPRLFSARVDRLFLAFSFIATVAEPQLESECDNITSQESLNLTNGKLESEEQPLQERVWNFDKNLKNETKMTISQ